MTFVEKAIETVTTLARVWLLRVESVHRRIPGLTPVPCFPPFAVVEQSRHLLVPDIHIAKHNSSDGGINIFLRLRRDSSLPQLLVNIPRDVGQLLLPRSRALS